MRSLRKLRINRIYCKKLYLNQAYYYLLNLRSLKYEVEEARDGEEAIKVRCSMHIHHWQKKTILRLACTEPKYINLDIINPGFLTLLKLIY